MEMSWILQAGVLGVHIQLRKATPSGCTSVGEGHSSGVASSGLFKSTDSRKRSSINYYFRLFKFREDKQVGGTRGKQKRERERQKEPCLLLCSWLCCCLHFLHISKCLPACLCHVTMQKPPHLVLRSHKRQRIPLALWARRVSDDTCESLRDSVNTGLLPGWCRLTKSWSIWSFLQWMFTALSGAAGLLERTMLQQHQLGLFLSYQRCCGNRPAQEREGK